MPKKIIKRFLPEHQTIKGHKYLQLFGDLLHDPGLWHLNRRSASAAFAIGLFVAFVPIPFQMVLAAAVAIAARANLALSVVLVWVSNPFTMPPMFYFAYKVGTWILGSPEQKFHFELSIDWLLGGLLTIWQPFLLGCLVVGTVSALSGYLLINGVWRLRVASRWRRKKEQRARRQQ